MQGMETTGKLKIGGLRTLREKLSENEKYLRISSFAANALILLFLLLITLGSYIKIKKGVLVVFLLICLGAAILKGRQMLRDFIKSPLMVLWLVYCVTGFLSGWFIKNEEDFYIVYTQISFTFILFTLTRFWDPKSFARMFRLYVLFFILCAVFQELTGIFPFKFLKEGTPYPYVDNLTKGISAVFESRHYFGVYMVTALLSLFFFPEKKALWNILTVAGLLLGIVLSYTRSVWISGVLGTVVGGASLLYTFLKSKRRIRKLTKKGLRNLLFSVGIVLAALTVLILIFRTQFVNIGNNLAERFREAFDPTSGSVTVRTYSIKNGTAYILQHWQKNIWIGMGNGSALEWLQEAPGAIWREAVDCQYVTTFMETGIIGLLSFLAMFFNGARYVFVHPDRNVKWWALSFLALGAALVFFDVVTVSSSIFGLFILMVVGMAPKAIKKQETERG